MPAPSKVPHHSMLTPRGWACLFIPVCIPRDFYSWRLGQGWHEWWGSIPLPHDGPCVRGSQVQLFVDLVKTFRTPLFGPLKQVLPWKACWVETTFPIFPEVLTFFPCKVPHGGEAKSYVLSHVVAFWHVFSGKQWHRRKVDKKMPKSGLFWSNFSFFVCLITALQLCRCMPMTLKNKFGVLCTKHVPAVQTLERHLTTWRMLQAFENVLLR